MSLNILFAWNEKDEAKEFLNLMVEWVKLQNSIRENASWDRLT